ncbi:tetratricopeptide repeat protein [uncultured Meiothermus sp.]|jgi:tetratricopeptide (TPR) repeat protein|uniref:tetratricopeptide repeat protein n=1 Tax=uncultured Meiothermus sp. TaxID=157471 RepID=UPI002635AE56|nr:tetratricopeptide repeat protein [uncultured Meiothermus sp.]
MELTAHILPRLKRVVLRRAGLALALWGEPGVGKSYCAQQLLRETACRSFSFHALTPLGALVRGLPRANKVPAWAEPPLLRLQKGEALDSKRTAEVLGALLAALAPVVLHLEDIHEAGPEGLEWIRDLAATALRTKGVALLVTSRNAPPEPFEEYRLAPLSPEASQTLLEAEVGSPLPEEALAWIYGRAQGNPLFCLEYLRYLARQGFLWSDGREWHWRPPQAGTLPLTVEALLERWLHQVAHTPTLRQTLESKALLGLGADPAVWAKVAGLSAPELNAVGLVLQQQGILRAGEFAHPLYQEVILHGLLPQERREYAQRALEALADQPLAAARYLEEAGLERKPALKLLRRAAEEARQAGHEAQAARWTARAVEYAQGEERGRMALEAAQVLQHQNLSEATRLVKMVLPTPTATAETVRFYTHLLARQGGVPDLEALFGELPPRLRTAVNLPSLTLTTAHIGGDNLRVLKTWEAHPELQRDPSPELLWAVAGSALATGQTEKAQTFVNLGLATPEAQANPTLRCEFLSTQALIHYHLGEYQAAEATLEKVLEVLAPLEVPRLRGTVLVNRAAILRKLGRYDEMSRCLLEAVQIRREAGDAKAYAFALAARAEALIEQGRYQAAEEALQEAIATLEPHGPSRLLAATHSMANLLYRSQDTPIAQFLTRKHAERALDYARQLSNPRLLREVLLDTAVAQTRCGYPERALALIAEAEGLAHAAGDSPHDAFQTLWAKGLALGALGEETARGALEQALELSQKLNLIVDEHKVGLELDRLTGNIESARNRLHWFEARGLLNGVHLARRYFPQLDSRPVSGQPQSQALPPGGARSAYSLCEYPSLEVLGPMQLTLEGKSDPVRGQKRRELLAVLLEARISGRGEVPTLELLERLYPGVPDPDAGTALKQTVFKTRASLGQGLVVTTAGGYALGAVESDVEVFLKTQQTRLWRGVYWQDVSLEADETVRGAVYHALCSSIRARLEADPSEAARLGRILLEADPYDLEALRLTCLALRQSGNHRGLAQVYQQARGHFLEVGEALPADWASFLEPVAR